MTIPWDGSLFSRPPAYRPAAGFSDPGVQAVWYDGLPWQGRPTRVFAWLGFPEGVAHAPGMVLVNGGGGTAFAEWVRLWNRRGYAAIAMDYCGCVPVGEYGHWQRHAEGGPPGWEASFAQLDDPLTDQWPYHAMADILQAHSLLASFPQVDAERIGVTGISWGGYLTSLTVGVDSRFKCAIPIYGCGFLGEDSVWLPNFSEIGTEKAGRWLAQWDPSVYLPHAAMPILWVTGTNDFAYPLGSWQKSYRLPTGPRTLSLRVNMVHDHNFDHTAEIHAFAEQHLNAGPELAVITGQNTVGRDAWVAFKSPVPILCATLNYTCDTGSWQSRAWTTHDADLDHQQGRAHATVPATATAYYLNLTDARGLMISSEHISLG